MTSVPRLSIGLPVYNGEDFLAESLDSLLGQTYRGLRADHFGQRLDRRDRGHLPPLREAGLADQVYPAAP